MSSAINVEEVLASWKTSLVANIPLGGLHSRNPTAHKWKALFRTFLLRETIYWRLQDLLEQSYNLHKQSYALGSRILLRSGFESVASLIHLNQIMELVISKQLNFHEFSDKTSRLLLGSKNSSSGPESANVVTVLNHCEKKYPGIVKMYAALSESAHPSYEGLCTGYSKIDRDSDEVNFSNRWMEMYGDKYLNSLQLCIKIFEHEYDSVWPKLMDRLENWVSENDVDLEATKRVPSD